MPEGKHCQHKTAFLSTPAPNWEFWVLLYISFLACIPFSDGELFVQLLVAESSGEGLGLSCPPS